MIESSVVIAPLKRFAVGAFATPPARDPFETA